MSYKLQLRVASLKARVDSLKARVKSQMCKFPFLYEYKFTSENKNKKRYSQASKHLRMPGTNLKIIKLTTSNLMQTKTFIKIKNLP